MSDILSAVLAGAPAEELAALPLPDTYRAAVVRRAETEHVRGDGVLPEGPPQVPPRRGGAAARAGPRRGLRGRPGLLHQLQHGVDLDLRAAAHLRLPGPPGPRRASGASGTPSTTTWSAPTPPAWCCAPGRPCATGRWATRSPSTATTSTTRTPRPTTTPCWRPTSASGASRPTSAAWPTSRWSRPTS